jgi:Transposase, Mutator family
MTELRNRGVQDILIAVVDGLKGFPEAITEECQELCVSSGRSGSLADRSQPWMGLKRSSNMMANWFTAVSHPLTVREVFSWPRIAR